MGLKPKLQVGREQKMLEALEEAAVKAEENVIIANEKNVKFGAENEVLLAEKNALLDALEESKGGAAQYLAKEEKLLAEKADVEGPLSDAQKRLECETEAKDNMYQNVKKTEAAVEKMKEDLEDMGGKLLAAQQEELISKLNKDKKDLFDANQKTAVDHQNIEDKCNTLFKQKGKMEQQLDELEDSLEREKKLKGDMEKAKRKVEGDYKLAYEANADLERSFKDLEATFARKDSELAALGAKIDDEHLGTARIGKQAKELLARLDELEDECKAESAARAKAEKHKALLAFNYEELSDKLDEAGSATAAQVEMNKKREAEIFKFKHDLEEMNIHHEAVITSLRKKHNDAIAEMSEQVDHLNKMKARSEKDKDSMRMEYDDAKAALDALARDKGDAEKKVKQIQFNYNELYTKYEENYRVLQDFEGMKKKLYVENQDLVHQLEESESQYATLHKLKLSLTNQYDDARKMADEENRDRAQLLGKFRNLEHDISTMRAKIEEQADMKADVQRQYSRAYGEYEMYKAKYETEGVTRAEELYAAKEKLQVRLDEAEQTIDALSFKYASLEKSKVRLEQDYEALHIDYNKIHANVGAAEKKQKNFDKILAEWKMKIDDLTLEYDNSQKEVRNYSTELFRMKTSYEENLAAFDSVKRENKNLGDEVKDLMDQIGEGGRNYHEVTKTYKRLEVEKEELAAVLEEAEAAFEQEENKYLRGQLELGQIKQEIERRLAEKDEEQANTKKTHARAMESLQASLEVASKEKAAVYKDKKKLESDINELEISYDHANKANADLQKHIKKLHVDYTEANNKYLEQRTAISEYKEQYGIAERRGNALYGELEESKTLLEQSDRARRQAESDLADAHEQYQNLFSANGLLTVAKRKLEGDLHTLHADLDEMLSESKHSEEKAKKAMVDAARLADELRTEHEHYQSYYKLYQNLEVSYKELYAKYEENYANITKSGKDAYAKLELKVKELENSLSDETNKYADCMKNYRKAERRIKEIAALNLAKYRKVQQTVETHEENWSITKVQHNIH